MDENLEKYLKEHEIEYDQYFHKPVYTVEEHRNIGLELPGLHTKNLFLKDNKNKFYLICLTHNKKLDTKILKSKFKLKELSFASPKELKEELNLTPGSVSLFGIIYSKTVFLILDKEIWSAKSVGFHPNINNATWIVNHFNLEKFYNSLPNEKEIMDL